MPQNPVPIAVVNPVNSSALQGPITISASGSYAQIGNPGGPVVFNPTDGPIVTAIYGATPRTAVKGRTRTDA